MRSRVLSSAVLPAIALPALAMSPASHTPVLPGFGISRAVHMVTTTVGSVTSRAPGSHRAHSSLPRAASAAARPRHFVAINCAGHPVVRPRAFELACADANDSLIRLHWQAWGRGYATATGIQLLNTCQPSCAHGRFHSYPVRAIFWGGAPVSGHPGEQRYTMITLLYTGQAPSVPSGSSQVPGPPSVTGSLWG
jgi:hypothetical protein